MGSGCREINVDMLRKARCFTWKNRRLSDWLEGGKSDFGFEISY
jgi:hypothetical protein